jgi:transcription elongation factor GreA
METDEQKFYLTKHGLDELKKEYDDLKKIRMAKTKGEAPNIWESEDLNPDYLSFKEDIELLEARLSELENVLKNSELIKKPAGNKSELIGLGATILVEIDGDKDEFILVGSYEANPILGKISHHSPVGKALMGHKVGDEVMVSSPIKSIYKIKKIKYN